jgi:hypothetical protein
MGIGSAKTNIAHNTTLSNTNINIGLFILKKEKKHTLDFRIDALYVTHFLDGKK